MKFFGSFGVGGKGVFDSRPRDQFGLGYYFINIDNPDNSGAASDQEIFYATSMASRLTTILQ